MLDDFGFDFGTKLGSELDQENHISRFAFYKVWVEILHVSLCFDASCDLTRARTSADMVSRRNVRIAQGKGMCQAQEEEPKGDQVDWQWQPGEEAAGVRMKGMNGWNGKTDEMEQEYETEERSGEGVWGR